MRVSIAVFGILSCAGCGPDVRSVDAGSNGSQTWKKGHFVVRFVAGPKDDSDAQSSSYSFYQVSRKFDRHPAVSNIGIRSAMDVRHFQQDPDSHPTDWIQFFMSPSGKTLLITEDIPNDCGPCQNHIVVTSDDDELGYRYLDLPSRLRRDRKGEIVEQVFGMSPMVTGISDTRIFYRYEDGTKVEEDLDKRAKSEKKPNFPG